MAKKLILHDYTTVIELIKFARANKHVITVEKKGNDFAGVYWEIKLKIPKNPLRKTKYEKKRI